MLSSSSTTEVLRPGWLPESEYPFRLRSRQLTNGTVAYIDEGEGPTLLFVHTGMWSFIFREVIVRLREEFRCVALDFPGFGLAPDPIRDPSLEDQSELLVEFAEGLELHDITLVLHDLGGPVGAGFAARRPGLVSGLVLANTFVWRPDTPSLVRMLRLASSRAVTVFDRLTRLIPHLTSTKAGVGLRLSREGKVAFRGPFRDRRRIQRFHTLLGDALESDRLYDRIEAAVGAGLDALPVLTIFGEKNDPFGFQERLHALFGDHEGLVIAGGNHFPMMDDPGLFADTVQDWSHRKLASRG